MFRISYFIFAGMLLVQLAMAQGHERSQHGFRGATGGPMVRKQHFSEASQMEKNPAQALTRALRNPQIAEELGLSEEQRDAITSRVKELKEEFSGLRTEIQEAAKKQARLMIADDLDEAALMQVVEETGRIRTEMAKLRVKHLLFMRKTLTPDQIEKAREIIGEKMRERRERMQKFRDHEGEQSTEFRSRKREWRKRDSLDEDRPER